MLHITAETMDHRAHRRASQATLQRCAPASLADAVADDLGLADFRRVQLQHRVAEILRTDQHAGTNRATLTGLVRDLYREVTEVGPSPSVQALDEMKMAGFHVLLLLAGTSVGHVVRFLGTDLDLTALIGSSRSRLSEARIARVFDPLRGVADPYALPEFIRAPFLERRLEGGAALCFRALKSTA